LADELVADLMQLSDAELLAEVKAEGLDPEKEAARVRETIRVALTKRGKARLEAARSALEAARATAPGARRHLQVDDRRAVLARFANDDEKLRERLTMAARNGEEITDEEVEAILNDLRDLGAIDDEGNPT
jgi:inactivated superfamily I helicase